MPKSFSELSPDFDEWPRRWMISSEDLAFGEEIIAISRPFIEHLISSKYTETTIIKHVDNLWLLGGELVIEINTTPGLRNSNALDLLMENMGIDGGPYSRHLQSEAEFDSFDATCGKLLKFLRKTRNPS